MAFRYLNVANSRSSEEKLFSKYEPYIENTYHKLSNIIEKVNARKDQKLSDKEYHKAYATIFVHLFENVPKEFRRDVIWKLCDKLPRYFFRVIKDIIYNCP